MAMTTSDTVMSVTAMPYHPPLSVHVWPTLYPDHAYCCSMMLDKQLRDDAEKGKFKIPFAPPDRYSTLLKQRHVQVGTRVFDPVAVVPRWPHAVANSCWVAPWT